MAHIAGGRLGPDRVGRARAAARIRIRQICGLGLAQEMLAAALVPAVRDLIPSDSGAIAWVDGQGRITNVYADRLSSMHHLASSEGELSTGRVLSAGVWHSGRELAKISLYRSPSGSEFSRDEKADLSGVMRYIEYGMALGHDNGFAAALSRGYADGPDEALVVTDRHGGLRHSTEEGRRMLLLAAGCRLDSSAISSVTSIVADLLRATCAQLDCVDARRPCTTVFATSWGRFVLRAYALDESHAAGGSLVGIRIQHQEPAMVSVVRAISRLQLSPQQRQIALLIAQGQGNRQIATSLGISCNTVAYHVRQLFVRLGVHDRATLMDKIEAA